MKPENCNLVHLLLGSHKLELRNFSNNILLKHRHVHFVCLSTFDLKKKEKAYKITCLVQFCFITPRLFTPKGTMKKAFAALLALSIVYGLCSAKG